MKKIFVIDKPSFEPVFRVAIENHFPQDIIEFVHLDLIQIAHLNFPTLMKHETIPHIGNPKFKPAIEMNPSVENIYQILREADEIIFAASLDDQAAVKFMLLISAALGIEKCREEFAVLEAIVIRADVITKSLGEMITTKHDRFKNLIKYGTANLYIDYNLTINTTELMGRALSCIGISAQNQSFHKYSVQLLYWLKRINTPQTIDQIMHELSAWNGSGKYSKGGSTALPLTTAEKRHEIFEGLIHLKLIQEIDGKYQLSTKGFDFINQLHRECYDPDLPYRINLWSNNWPESRETINRYINTYFGRLKRHLDHHQKKAMV